MTETGSNGDERVVDALDPAEAFELLAHETRFAILEALNDADGPVAFSELRAAVGADDPGGFNYHLRKLTGRFVRDGDDGYEIAGPGRQVVGAVLSGVYTYRLDADPVSMPAACLGCGGDMETRFDETAVRMVCLSCDTTFHPIAIPPGVLEGWPRERTPDAIDRWVRHIRQTAELGLCYTCGGRTRRRVDPLDEDAPAHLLRLDLAAVVENWCGRCGAHWREFPAAGVLAKPSVIAFHHEHGLDVQKTPFWELDWLETGVSSIAAADPLRVEVPIEIEDETLVVTTDDELSVVATRRI
ncbi:helix-turn-helix domain-containing protein [Halovivax sp.]|uniref:winged helix-turn-helix domain-containing protein n=1 Tax=Halovivax sp. TaxID=1935978 RepID=UPI0025C585A1|nr:helix-turn-helix domain-containing protein [Halovivax sp.]